MSNLATVFVYILYPVVMVLQPVSRYPNDLHVAIGKVRSATSDFPELSGADRSEISGMRKQYRLIK
jgi:hypothetical protein